jgi:cytochrome c553
MNFRLVVIMVTGAMMAMMSTATLPQGAAKGDPAKARPIVEQICAACHGKDGISTAAVNPNLAGQHPEYVVRQLMSFRPQGGKPPERSNAVMAGMVANLKDDDLPNLAAYFAAQKPALRAARDPELARLGQAIYRGGIMSKGVAACASCHAPNGAGVPAQFPRIAGQHTEYTEMQLKAFRSGERRNDPNRMMRAVAAKLSDGEIRAVAEYVAGLR